LVGGETAEMPGFYQSCDYDLAGFVVGAVERSQVLPKAATVSPGDALVGVASSGVHSNGFSLVNHIIQQKNVDLSTECPWDSEESLGAALLKPTEIYVKAVLPLMKSGKIKAAAHITGGGLLENLPRSLPEGVDAELEGKSWVLPPVFDWIATTGQVAEDEMLKTFNCGIGFVLVVAPDDAESVVESLKKSRHEASIIGQLVESTEEQQKPEVFILNKKHIFRNVRYELSSTPDVKKICLAKKKRVAVLISGSGTNLQALIDHTSQNGSAAEIVLVLSNKEGVAGLDRATKGDIPTRVISHKAGATVRQTILRNNIIDNIN
jgi:phosphoribosylamine--glycine ligase/phosphoribosylglycinamide formyltransferase/phosphoribosylformylglycinamidine cyclo-ligase